LSLSSLSHKLTSTNINSKHHSYIFLTLFQISISTLQSLFKISNRSHKLLIVGISIH
jgi:hypothetical protein